jgi:NAD(P)-dependent dehydrogenase (short-subunit alcohol dehydrogenase family)
MSGARVVVVDINEEAAKAVCQNIKAKGGKAYSIKADVSVKKQVEIMIESSVEKLGGLDILVNSAGINKFVPILDLKEEDWDAIIAVNTKGVFLCSQAAARLMVAQKNGRIVNISSNCSRIARMFMELMPSKSSCKLALHKVLALVLLNMVFSFTLFFLVTPNCDATRDTKETGWEKKLFMGIGNLSYGIPLGKWQIPEEICCAVFISCSDVINILQDRQFA